MDHDDHITRRAFGRVVGAAAAAGRFQAFGASASEGQSGQPASTGRSGSDELCEMSAVDLAARIRR